MHLDFATPAALLLFVVLGVAVIVLNRFSRVYLAPGRRRAALVLRLVLMALIALALAQPRLALPQNSVNVVFLVDTSDSVGPTAVQDETQWIRQAMTHLGPKDRAGVVVFGANALVESALTHTDQLPDLASEPVRSHTDIAGAIRLGMAMLSGSGGRRLVLLSDGNQNLGSALDETQIAAVSGIEVSALPLQQSPHASVFVDHLTAPATLRKGERFDVTGSIQSTVATPGTLFLFTDGVLTAQQDVTVRPGSNTFTFGHDPVDQGFHTFSVRLETSGDPTPENKQASAFSYVKGEPKVLLVEGQAGAGAGLSKALVAAGVEVNDVPPTGIPSDLAQLRSYDSVVLVNVPATDLAASLLQTLKLYVRDLGGGLVTVGGDKSYASGQYTDTPLEEILPVSSQVAPRKNLPSTAVVFIIESLENSLGIDISKEAAKAAINYLSSTDQVAVNDTSGGWAVPLQNVTDKAGIDSKIDSMSPSDPSSYAPALQAAAQVLAATNAKTKHIVLMGDGDATDNYQATIQGIAASGITVSVVGTNVQPDDLSMLQDIARWGNGRYYDGNDPFDIPQLLTKETQLVARPAIVEESFRPTVASSSQALRGIAAASLPPLLGYVATTAKPTAQVVLASNQQDPILAEWQYGLGHVLAWTSDAGGRWATQWTTWPQFSTFWSQVVRESLPSNVDQTLQTAVTATDQGAHVTLDSIAPDRSYRNFLTTRATIVDPKGRQSTLTLEQTSPGRYEGDFPTPDQGTYLVQVVQMDQGGKLVATQPTGYSVDYSPEYREITTNATLLKKVTQLTRGRLFTSPDQVFQHDLQGSSAELALWPWLLALSLFVLLLDVGTRRLRLGGRELAQAVARLRGRMSPAPAVEGKLAGLRRRVLETRGGADRATAGGATAPALRRERLKPARPETTAAGATVSQVAARLHRQRGAPVAAQPRLEGQNGPPVLTLPAPTRLRPPSVAEVATPRPRAQPAPGDAESSRAADATTSEQSRSRLLEAKRRAREGRE